MILSLKRKLSKTKEKKKIYNFAAFENVLFCAERKVACYLHAQGHIASLLMYFES